MPDCCWPGVSLHPEGPATGQLDRGFPSFSSASQQMLSWYPDSHVALHASHAELPTLRSEFLPNGRGAVHKKCFLVVLVLILLWGLQIVHVGRVPNAADINRVQTPNSESPCYVSRGLRVVKPPITRFYAGFMLVHPSQVQTCLSPVAWCSSQWRIAIGVSHLTQWIAGSPLWRPVISVRYVEKLYLELYCSVTCMNVTDLSIIILTRGIDTVFLGGGSFRLEQRSWRCPCSAFMQSYCNNKCF
jgi:hypothetical protein